MLFVKVLRYVSLQGGAHLWIPPEKLEKPLRIIELACIYVDLIDSPRHPRAVFEWYSFRKTNVIPDYGITE